MRTKEQVRAGIVSALRKRKKRLKSIGICQDCGDCPKKEGRTLCESCLEARRVRAEVKRREKGIRPKTNVESMIVLAEKPLTWRRNSA
jgi:hypothetical protein